jgi:hypothetical protein
MVIETSLYYDARSEEKHHVKRTLQCLFCQVNDCSVVTRFAVFRDILYYSMYILYYFM